MTDRFSNHAAGVDAPASDAFAIVPGVGALSQVTRAIYVGSAGQLAVTMLEGSSVTFINVPAATLLPIRASHVLAATTAGNLVGLV